MKQNCKCGKLAVWVYAPATKNDHPYYCDDCIIDKDSLGCSCNWENIDVDPSFQEGIEGVDWAWIDAEKAKEHKYSDVREKQYWQKLQPNGKPWPCCEYWKDEEGFEVE